MTLYLVFDALEAGQIKLSDKVTISKNAARTPPVKMGLKAGHRHSIHELIQAVAVKSYNDAAVALAEHLAGSEENFAQLMTKKAKTLGMRRTVFKTANGLPHPEQFTTARDMAKLANAVLKNHSAHYHYFGQQYFRGSRNTNALLFSRDDVDGFKTGFTNDSGYNLLVSAIKDGRRQITVVLGGASSATRNRHMSDLINRGFNIMGLQPSPIIFDSPSNNTRIEDNNNNSPQNPNSQDTPVIIKLRGTNSHPRAVQTAGTPLLLPKGGNNWSVQIKNFTIQDHAITLADSLKRQAGMGEIVMQTGFLHGQPVFHARLSGLPAKTAQEICASRELSLALGQKRCLIIAP